MVLSLYNTMQKKCWYIFKSDYQIIKRVIMLFLIRRLLCHKPFLDTILGYSLILYKIQCVNIRLES